MYKSLLFVVAATLLAEAIGQHIIYPTYRPPPTRGPVIRTARSADRSEPQWLYSGDIPRAPSSGDHPVLPNYIDDMKLHPNRRYARSVDSPSAKRGGGGHSPSGSRDTGATHPGYNRRNTRSLHDAPLFPRIPKPLHPTPLPIEPKKPFPIYA